MNLIETRTDPANHCDVARGLLTCGHYGPWVHVASSDWDFPGEPHTCSTCGESRQFDLRLQLRLYDDNEGNQL